MKNLKPTFGTLHSETWRIFSIIRLTFSLLHPLLQLLTGQRLPNFAFKQNLQFF